MGVQPPRIPNWRTTIQNANTTDSPRTEPPTDRVADSSAPQQPPLKLEAEPVEERIVPLIY